MERSAVEDDEENEVSMVLGGRSSRLPPVGPDVWVVIDINQDRYVREIDAQYQIQQAEEQNSLRMTQIGWENHSLRNEIETLREQLTKWNQLAMNVVENTDREVKKCLGELNDAVLLGIDMVTVSDSDEC
ncbi:hypothetical protein AAF712_008773 [Marasmius tenuissimus]|uniref:Uncharacterized protein n=1 Tax=Marasmius tenuissimus TaxID=585030 RepID=A0ABR2ZTB3_9AGAR